MEIAFISLFHFKGHSPKYLVPTQGYMYSTNIIATEIDYNRTPMTVPLGKLIYFFLVPNMARDNIMVMDTVTGVVIDSTHNGPKKK